MKIKTGPIMCRKRWGVVLGVPEEGVRSLVPEDQVVDGNGMVMDVPGSTCS